METIDTNKQIETGANGVPPEDQTEEQRALCKQTEYDEKEYFDTEIGPRIRELHTKCVERGIPLIAVCAWARDKEKSSITTSGFVPGRRAPNKFHEVLRILEGKKDPIADLLDILLGK